MTCKERKILWSLCVLAFALRIGAIWTLHSWIHPDPMEHRSIAVSLVNEGCFCFTDFGHRGPSSFQSPPYPLLLAAMFKIFGVQSAAAYQAVMALNALVGALCVWLTYRLARTMGGGSAVGLVAAGAVAVWPTQIYACTVAQAVVLITAGVTALPSLFYAATRSGRFAPWLGFSVVGCIAALTEPAFLPAMALSGLLILFARRLEIKTRVRNSAALLVVALAVLGPWTYRNYRVHGAFVPVKSSFWVNTWKGNNDFASGTDRVALSKADASRLRWWHIGDPRAREVDGVHAYRTLDEATRARLMYKSELEREKIFKEITVAWIRSHPAAYARLCGLRLGKTLWVDWENPKTYNLFYVLGRALLLCTAGIGLLIALRRRWTLGFAALLYLSTLALYTLTITAARFALPFEPMMLCLSSLAVISAWERIRGAGAADKQASSAVPAHAAL